MEMGKRIVGFSIKDRIYSPSEEGIVAIGVGNHG